MDDATGETAVPTGTRRPRQGEAFWCEMVMAWTISGLGLRRFCREQGLAVSTFGLWRKKLSGEALTKINQKVGFRLITKFGEKGIVALTPLVLAAMAYQTVAVAFASYLAWFALMRTYPASTLSAFTFLSPLFAMIFGATLLHERVSWALAAALAFVAFGIWLVNRPRQRSAS